jgi:hypothetical protein
VLQHRLLPHAEFIEFELRARDAGDPAEQELLQPGPPCSEPPGLERGASGGAAASLCRLHLLRLHEEACWCEDVISALPHHPHVGSSILAQPCCSRLCASTPFDLHVPSRRGVRCCSCGVPSYGSGREGRPGGGRARGAAAPLAAAHGAPCRAAAAAPLVQVRSRRGEVRGSGRKGGRSGDP